MLPHPRLARLVRCATGLVLLGVGLGLTVAADLGLAPWDVLWARIALMTGLARRGLPVGPVRSGIEVAALATGYLGGTVGVGTVVFAVGVGPNVAWWLPRLAMPGPVDPAVRANLQP